MLDVMAARTRGLRRFPANRHEFLLSPEVRGNGFVRHPHKEIRPRTNVGHLQGTYGRVSLPTFDFLWPSYDAAGPRVSHHDIILLPPTRLVPKSVSSCPEAA